MSFGVEGAGRMSGTFAKFSVNILCCDFAVTLDGMTPQAAELAHGVTLTGSLISF